MRFQDELLTAFRSQTDPDVRRYVLRQMLDLPVAVDSEDVLAVLRDEERTAGSGLAAQATTALTVLLPRIAAVDFGFDARANTFIDQPLSRSGTSKSRSLAVADLEKSISNPRSLSTMLQLDNDEWAAAGSHLLEPCLAPLIAKARGTGADRDASLRALSRILHHQARKTLEELSRMDPLAALALAQTADPTAEPAVLEALDRPGALRAELVRLLGLFPSAATRRAVEKAFEDPDETVKTAAGTALEGFAAHEPLAMAKRLLTSCQERWPLVHAADSLGRAATPEAVPDLIALYRSSDDVLVQVTCVLAVSNLGGEASVPFFLELLRDGHDMVRADALEALVLQLYPLADLKEQAVRFLSSQSPQLAMNAAIIVSKIEPELATRKVVEWLSSPAKGARLRGAYLLGYLRSEASLRVTAHLANADPSVPVRMELLRCLSRYAPEEAGPALEACLVQTAPQVRSRAIHLWARNGNLSAEHISERLVQLLVREADTMVRGKIVELLGQVGDGLARETLAKVLASDDERVAARAAAAMGVVGDPALAGALVARARTGGPELKARAALALFALADLRALEPLVPMIEEGGSALEHASRALEEICLLLPRLPASPRHKALKAMLDAHMKTPAYAEFAKRRLSSATRNAVLSSVYKRPRKVDLDMTGTVAASSTAQLKELNITAIVAKARGDSGKVDRQALGRFGLEAPRSRVAKLKERRRRAVAVLAAVGLIVGAVVALGSGEPADRAALLGRGMAPIEGLLVLGTVGDATGGPLRADARALARNTVLKAPFALATGKQSRLTALIGPSPDDQILLGAESGLTVQVLSGVPGAKNAYTLEISALAGECTLDLKSGDPRASVELPGATVESRRGHLQIKTKPDRISVKLVSGNAAALKFAGQSSPLEAGKLRSWKVGDNPVTR